MKRFLFGIGLLGAAAFLGGCPIYPSQGNEYRVCQGAGCYSCPDQTYSGACIPWQCSQDSDCDSGYVCSSQDQCIPAPPDSADAGDCSINGCPTGSVCELANGVAQCVALATGGGDGGGDAPTSTVDAGPPDAPPTATACNGDGDCTAQGSRCVDGLCTAQVDLCSDGTQCKADGAACVDGICEARCNASTPCPSGYGCDFTLGVCSLNPGACTGSGTSTCEGGATCVEGHCVPPCTVTEGGTECAGGQVCVNGGCIPDQAASFACSNDGDQGGLANACPDGSTCLHHDCYAACELDGSGAGCGAKSGSSCKDVRIETGTYAVCAPNGMLGSECDPAQGTTCANGTCVDGSCR